MLTIPASLEEVLTDSAHRLATLWRIIRDDQQRFHFTDHDQDLTFKYATYRPVGSFRPSAIRRQSGLKDQNRELRGAIRSDGVTAGDLHGGLFRGARVTEYIVDWRYPWEGYFVRNEYIITKVEFDSEQWIADLGGPATVLHQSRGDVVDRHCRYADFGNAFCGIDLDGNHPTSGEPYTSGPVEVYEVVNPNLISIVGSIENWADGDGTGGWIEWISGLNAGLRQRVGRHWVNTHPAISGSVLELYDVAPFTVKQDKVDLQGDLFFAAMGCSRRWSRCGYFGNQLNFGGFPYIPGTDRVIESPAVASGV